MDDAGAVMLSLAAEHRYPEADAVARGKLAEAMDHTYDTLAACLDLNAKHSADLAQQIGQMRTASLHSALVLNALCVIWPLALALLFVYGFRRQSAQREAERREAMERAAELEQFAGRVAHDIRNPLSAISMVMGALEVAPQERRTDMLKRGRSGVRRIEAMLDGLLKFACAGARPEPSAHADAREVMAGLATELGAQAAEAGISLLVVPSSSSAVACNPGILLSLIQNLTENAIKYMGESTERRITIRMVEQRTVVRFEVEDTGPGLPPGMETAVFNPHVRVRGSAQPGFGLGLATVKKAAEAHGGRVGVRSAAGRGCLFWFELPKAAPPPPEPG
jgi:signal transduction histidine kinase